MTLREPLPASVRAFVALDIDDDAAARLRDLMQRLQPHVRGLRWVRPEGLHLTLRFLGWTRAEVLAAMEPALAAAAAACAAADVPLGPLGMFPARGSPRVLWVGVTLPARFSGLQAACEQAAVAAGLEPEGRAFSPHLTLGRFQDRARRPDLERTPAATVALGTTRVDRVVLYRSEMRSGGSVYTPLRTFPLG